MLFISNIEKIKVLTSKEMDVLKNFTAKDRIYIITEEDAAIPVSLFSLLSDLKTKPNFVSLAKDADTSTEFFLYGMLAAGAKTGEDICILNDTDTLINLTSNNVKFVKILTASLNKKAITTKKKVETVVKTKERTVVKKEENANSLKVISKTDNTEKFEEVVKEISANEEEIIKAVLKYPAMKKYEKEILERKADMIECIKNSSDKNIGFKIMLETRFGRSVGEEMWNALSKVYDMLKSM